MGVLEVVIGILVVGWAPLALFLIVLLMTEVKAAASAWRAAVNPFGIDRALLTPVGNKLLTALRWVVGLGLASWALLALLAWAT